MLYIALAAILATVLAALQKMQPQTETDQPTVYCFDLVRLLG